MAKGSRGGRRSGGGANAQVTAPTPQTAPTAQTIVSNGGIGLNVFDPNFDPNTLSDKILSDYDADLVDALKYYVDDVPRAGGYSYSQALNYKLNYGGDLTTTEKFIDRSMQSGMHDLGINTNLVRFAHDGVLRQMGVSDYSKLTDKQLQNKLVGTTFTTKSYTSTSYNSKNSPFAPGQSLGGGREVIMNIKAKSNTKVLHGDLKQSEIILNRGTNYKVTGIRYNGQYATPRGKGRRPVVVLDVEVI